MFGVLFSPRIAARAKRIQAAHDARDTFSESVLSILSMCANLESLKTPLDAGDDVRSKIEGERRRWQEQISEATAWLVDHWQRTALGYPGRLGIRDLVVRYSAVARGVWLSGRPPDERVRILRELTEPVQTIYFARRWRVIMKIQSEIKRLRQMLDSFERGDDSAA